MTANFPEERAASDPRDDRHLLAEDLLNELAGWGPADRAGTLKSWHRGALSVVHLNVLTILETHGPLSMSRLAETLDVAYASATGIVDRMEQRGVVERRHATDDRRVVVVHLTERGAAVFHDLEAHMRERLAGLLEELTQDELAGLLAGLRALGAAKRRLVVSGDHDERGRTADHAVEARVAADAGSPVST